VLPNALDTNPSTNPEDDPISTSCGGGEIPATPVKISPVGRTSGPGLKPAGRIFSTTVSDVAIGVYYSVAGVLWVTVTETVASIGILETVAWLQLAESEAELVIAEEELAANVIESEGQIAIIEED